MPYSPAVAPVAGGDDGGPPPRADNKPKPGAVGAVRFGWYGALDIFLADVDEVPFYATGGVVCNRRGRVELFP